MGAEKRRRFQPDPRTWLLLCLLGIAAILVIRSEIGCLCLFLACLLIHLLAGNGGKILPYGLYYLIFYGIGWLGVRLMDSGSCLFGQFHVVQHRHRQPEGTGAPLLCHLPGGGAHRLPDGGAAKTASAKGRGDRGGGRAAILSDNRRGISGHPFFPAVPWDRGRGAAHPYPPTNHGGVYSDSAYPSHDEGGGGTLRLYDGAGRAVFR